MIQNTDRHSDWGQVALAMLEQSPFAIAMFDRQMRYIFASQRWLSNHRLQKADLRGRSHYEIFPDLPERWKQIHQRCMEGAVESSEEEAFVRADGTVAWVRWEVRPWHDRNGQVGGIVIFSEDISRRIDTRKALEELNQELEKKFRERSAELVRSEQKFRMMFESAYDSILVTDKAGGILMVNEQLTRKFGYRSEELIGKAVEILVPERFRAEHVAKRGAYASNPSPRPMGTGGDLYGRHKDGSEFPIEVALNPITTPDGLQIHATIRDISDRRKLEERESFLSAFSKTLSETFDYQERLQVAVDLVVPGLADICVLSMLEGDELEYRAFAFRDPSMRQRLRSSTHIQATGGNSAYTAYHVVRTGHPLLVEDVATELLAKSDLDAEQRIRLELVGATSFATFPLVPRGAVVGAITFVMTDSGRKVGAKDMNYLELIAYRCAVAVENAKLYHEAQR
ncbi:MAG TPA: PAS domain S-box protein, partial [Pseudomonadales bacterium]